MASCQHNSLEVGEVRVSPIFPIFWLLQSKSQLLSQLAITLVWLVAPTLGGIFLTPGPYCLHSPAPTNKHYKSLEELTVGFAIVIGFILHL